MNKKMVEFVKARFAFKSLLTFVVFLGSFSLLYLTKLTNLIPTGTRYEKPETLHYISIDAILQNIVYAPVKFLEYFSLKISQTPNWLSLRLISVLIVLISLIIFYRLVHKWRGSKRVALLATLMFGSSSYLLGFGRFTNPELLQLIVIPGLILIGTWIKTKKHLSFVFLSMFGVSIMLYIPGVWLMIGILAIIFRKRLLLAWKYSPKKQRIIGSAISALSLIPLVYALYQYPKQFVEVLGIDNLTINGISAVGNKLIDIPDQLFLNGPDTPSTWLIGTPVLDVVAIVFVVLGIIAYKNSQHTLRAKLLLYLGVVSVLIVSMSNKVTIALIVPLIFMLIARGIAYMLQNWFAVFPRNPIARSLGVALVLIPVFLSTYYNIYRYFEVYPKASLTVQTLGKK